MPRKEWQLLARDIVFYVTGAADVGAAEVKRDPWLNPLDWSFQLDRVSEYFSPQDEHGIPVRDFGGTIGVQYLPSRIAGFGLANWNRWREFADEDARVAFFEVAEWFMGKPDGLYRHDFPVAGLESGWLSCIAQGEAASVLARAYHATGDIRYRSMAVLAVAPFEISVAKQGLLDHLPDGSPFLEEYPCSIYRHVLNGCLYAVVGLHDVIRCFETPPTEIVSRRDTVVSAIADNIDGWSVGNWTSYDFNTGPGARRNPNTMTYHRLQAILLDYIGEFSGRPELIAAARAWHISARSPIERLKSVYGKLAYRFLSGY